MLLWSNISKDVSPYIGPPQRAVLHHLSTEIISIKKEMKKNVLIVIYSYTLV
jgi:hypothetical protein